MSTPLIDRPKRTASVFVFIAATVLALLRTLFPERPMDYAGPRALLDTVFVLGLLGVVLLLAGGLGVKVLRGCRASDLAPLEKIIFALPIGLGVIAYGVMALGLAGMMHPWTIFLWLIFVGIWTRREWASIVAGLPRRLSGLPTLWRKWGPGERVLVILGGLILGVALLQSLGPPTDYDGLMYHLPAGQIFLRSGRITLLPDTGPANGPATGEMLFIIGQAFGSDSFSRLIHLTYTALWLLASFRLGQRWAGHIHAWLTVALLLSIPMLPFWASMAYTDLIWVTYELLSLFALSIWREKRQHGWLLLGGLLMGWALGSKYLALGGLGVWGLWLLAQSDRRRWKEAMINGAVFGGVALAVGSPWYLKNWFLSENPVYPFIWGGPGWDAVRLNLARDFVYSFGDGRGWVDYLLLPLKIYLRFNRFGTNSLELPSFLFILVLLYPFFRRRGFFNDLAMLSALRFVLWALGSQQVRFLLPIFPLLSLLTASVMDSLGALPGLKRMRRVFIAVLSGVGIVTTFLISAYAYAQYPTTSVLLGLHSKDTFLYSLPGNYRALQFVKAHLDSQQRALMMWDGRGYYCDERCIPDADQALWPRIVSPSFDSVQVALDLQAMGVTHLLFSYTGYEFVSRHDPSGQQKRAADFFWDEFRPRCTREIYADQWTNLFEVTCR